MKYSNVSVKLKNNAEVTIRMAVPADAEKLLNTMRTYVADSPFIPKLESEIQLSVSQEMDWITKYVNQENSLLLVAEHKGQIVGNIDLSGNTRKIMQHTAMVGMGMLQQWQKIGLGTALLAESIAWAKQNTTLEFLILQVYTKNIGGLKLYKKMGFVERGVIPQFFKHDDVYFDVLTMSLSVK